MKSLSVGEIQATIRVLLLPPSESWEIGIGEGGREGDQGGRVLSHTAYNTAE